jgi:ribosomal protein L15E
MTDNVFQFPKDKIVREVPPNIDEIEKHRERGRQNYAEDIVGDIAENLILLLDSYGVDQDGKHFEKDFIFAIDSIRSSIYRAMNVDHNLHEFIDKHVSVIKKDENSNIILDETSEIQDILLEELSEKKDDDIAG